MDAGSNELSTVLNTVAGKLNARCWILSDVVEYDSKTRKPLLPRKLFFGSAIFYRTSAAIPFNY
ncbi:hypothetical protein EV701_10657 [Chthoniobacter flavus]|nr:hypothetical protein EV701_10657 [Chthoniobacter flavus]